MRKAVRGHMIQIKYLLDVRPCPIRKQGLFQKQRKSVFFLLLFFGVSVCVNADRTGQLAPLLF